MTKKKTAKVAEAVLRIELPRTLTEGEGTVFSELDSDSLPA
jgi:hypothetical protein